MREGRGAYGDLMGKPDGKRQFGGLGLDGKIILKSIFKKWNERVWIGLIWLGVGTGGGRL
jgi:hypothetical protein